MEFISFLHPDTNKKIELDISKKFVFIYGGNGTGKTTLSRVFDKNDYYIFNVDFVNQNVYVVDSNGAKTDSTTKSNLSSLFLGEESVLLSKIIDSLNVQKKFSDEKYSLIKNQIEIEISKFGDKFDINRLLLKINYNFVFDEQVLDYESNFSKFFINKKLESLINNDEELKRKIEIVNIEGILKELFKIINTNEIMKYFFIDQNNLPLKEINLKINKYNINLEEIKRIENSFSSYENFNEVKKWIEAGIKLHEKINDCIFCDSKNIDAKKDHWKSIIGSELSIMKKELISQCKIIIDSLIKIANNSIYIPIIPKIYNSSKSIIEILNIYITNIENNEFVLIKDIEDINIGIDDVFVQNSELIEHIRNYILSKKLKDLVFPYIFSVELKKSIELTKQEVEKQNLKFSTSIQNEINLIQKNLGFTKDILIALDNRSLQPKINIEADNNTKKISNYSEGQRHKIALAIFFAKIKKDNKKIKKIVLDDPVISLDVKAYHYLKALLIEFGEPDSKLILLTHNIHYLFIQLSNFFDNPQLKNDCIIYEISSNGSDQIQLDTLKDDDITIFKKAITQIEDINDISIIYWMTMKILRFFLDLKLRINGISSSENPNEEISKLNLDIIVTDKLKSNNSYINKICKNKIVNIAEIVISLKCLNESLNLLGFPNLITESDLDKFDKFIKEKTIENPKPKNKTFDIINYARNMVFCNEKSRMFKQLSNYICHPRNQITESLIAIHFEKDEMF